MKNRLIAILVAVLPAVAVIIAGWIIWIGPNGTERSAAEVDMLQTSNELRSAQVQLGKAREFAGRGNDAVAHLAALRLLLPAEPDVGSFVTLNADAARSIGVEVLSVVPEQPSSEADSSFVIDDNSSPSSGPSSTDSGLGDEVSATESTGGTSPDGASVDLPDGVDAVNVSVTVRGSDAQIPVYLASISGLSRLVLINEVSTVAEGDGNTSATLRLSVLYRSD